MLAALFLPSCVLAFLVLVMFVLPRRIVDWLAE